MKTNIDESACRLIRTARQLARAHALEQAAQLVERTRCREWKKKVVARRIRALKTEVAK